MLLSLCSCYKYVITDDIVETKTVLQMGNNSLVKPVGESKAVVHNPDNGQ